MEVERRKVWQCIGCGRIDDGAAPPATVCAALRRARWTVTDEFTPGLGGSKHVDVYIGEETGPDWREASREKSSGCLFHRHLLQDRRIHQGLLQKTLQ